MATLQFSFADQDVGAPFTAATQEDIGRVKAAMENTARWAADQILTRGRANIAGAGKFGARWTEGLHADVDVEGDEIRVGVSHDIPYFMIYEVGGIIKGAPLLWVATSWAPDAQNLGSVRNYPGTLVKVAQRISGGPPLLINPLDKQVKFVGLESIRIPKKFAIVEIVQGVAAEIPGEYSREYGVTNG